MAEPARNSLRLGNVFNKVESLGANTQENTARSLALANTLSGVADTLSGKDYQPGMSGFEQALIAGVRGASSGLQGKAAIEKAKGQDELNAYAKSLADNEMQLAKIDEIERKEQESVAQAAPAVAAATIAFAEGKTDEQTYTATVSNIVKTIMQSQGKEVVSVTKQGNDPFTFAVTVKDPETGETETDIRNVGKEFGGAVLKMDAEMGKAFIASAGRLPANYFQKEEKPTGKLAEFQQYKDALAQAQTPEEKAQVESFFGKQAKPEKMSVGEETFMKKLADDVVKNPPESFTASVDSLNSIADQLISSGMDTGFGTGIMATIAGGLGSALGIEGLQKYASDAQALGSQLKQAALSKIKLTGANPSNADRIYIDEITGNIDTEENAILKNVALQAATAYKGQLLAQVNQNYVMGNLTKQERDAKLAELNADNSPYTLRNLHSALYGEIKARQAQAMQARAQVPAQPVAPTPAAQSTMPNPANINTLKSKYGLE